MELQSLDVGKAYEIRTKDWTAPTGEIIPGQAKRRVFVRHVSIESVPFIEVEREPGRRHLIAEEAIAGIAVAAEGPDD